MDPLKYIRVAALLFAMAVAVSPSSWAQQMVRTPAPQPDSADAVESKGEPSVSIPTAEEPPEAAETPPENSKPTAPPKKEKVSAKTKATQPPALEAAAPSPTSRRNEEATLKELEDNWQAAIMAHNAAIVDLLLAADFAGVDRNGKFINKAAVVAEVRNDRDTYQLSKNDKVNVHLYGPTIAVVTGSTRSKGTTKAGKAFDRAYRYTDTWVQRDGKWQCVASQDSLLGPP